MAGIAIPARFFTTDKLQQVYLVTAGNEVIKCDASGRELFRYNNNTLGALTHIDATNPFNLLCYYAPLQTVVTLDRTLNKLEEFSLWNFDAVDVQAIAMAADNAFWLFDNATYRLRLIDQSGRVLRESDNLSQLLSVTPAPVGLVAREQLVYVNDPALGILIFDTFAQYVRTLPITGISDLQVIDGQLLYCRAGRYYLADNLGARETPAPLPGGIEGVRQVRVEKNRLYVLHKTGLDIYAW